MSSTFFITSAQRLKSLLTSGTSGVLMLLYSCTSMVPKTEVSGEIPGEYTLSGVPQDQLSVVSVPYPKNLNLASEVLRADSLKTYVDSIYQQQGRTPQTNTFIARELYAKALYLERIGQYDQAAMLWPVLRDLTGEHPSLLFQSALSELRRGEVIQSIDHLEQQLELEKTAEGKEKIALLLMAIRESMAPAEAEQLKLSSSLYRLLSHHYEHYLKQSWAGSSLCERYVQFLSQQQKVSTIPHAIDQCLTKKLSNEDLDRLWLLKAKFYADQGQQSAAIKLVEQHYRGLEHQEEMLVFLVDQWVEREQIKKALDLLVNYLKQYPGKVDLMIKAVAGHQWLQQWDRAIYWQQQVVDSKPKSLDAKIELVQLYALGQKKNLGSQLLEEMMLQYPTEAKVLLLGHRFAKVFQLNEEPWIEALGNLSPQVQNSNEVFMALSQYYQLKLENNLNRTPANDGASLLERWQAILARWAVANSTEVMIEVKLQQIFWTQDHSAQLIGQKVDELIDLMQDHPFTAGQSYQLGVLLDNLKRYEQFDLVMNDFVKKNPMLSQGWNLLAYSLAMRATPNLVQAKQYARKAYQLKQNDPYILDTLGWVAFLSQEYTQACLHLEKAFSLAQQNPVIMRHLYVAYQYCGKHQDALALLDFIKGQGQQLLAQELIEESTSLKTRIPGSVQPE